MAELILKEEVFRIMGAAMEVYNVLKSGFNESVYQSALELEFGLRSIPFARQVPLRVKYKDQVLDKHFIADLICFGSVLVELKAITQLTLADEAQLHNYLRATGLRVGLLINFGNPDELKWKRLINGYGLDSDS